MSARAFEQWLASLTALFDFWTGNHGHKSSSRRCAVKIVRETNDACEPFNCSTCSLVRPLRKRGGDNFSSTAVRFRFQLRHRRASRKKKNGATSWTVTVATTTWLGPTFPLEMPDGFVLQLVKLPPWRSRLSERWSIYWKFHVRTNFNLNRWNLLNRIANYWNRCTIFYRVKLNLKLKYFLHFRRSRTFVSLKHFVDYQDEVF